MNVKIDNYNDLKNFCNNLTEEQLKQPVTAWGEIADGEIISVDILEEDHINPTGETAEPISDYTKTGDYTKEEIDGMLKENLVAKKGEIKLFLDQSE